MAPMFDNRRILFARNVKEFLGFSMSRDIPSKFLSIQIASEGGVSVDLSDGSRDSFGRWRDDDIADDLNGGAIEIGHPELMTERR